MMEQRTLGLRSVLRVSAVVGVVLAGALAVAPGTAAAGAVVHLPISAFTSAQGTTHVFSPPMVPPIPDYGLGWTGSQADGYPYLAVFDYSGLANAYLVSQGKPNLGTTITGDVQLRSLADGRVEVTVNLQAKNALAFVQQFNGGVGFDPLTSPIDFGTRVTDVLGGAAPTVGDCHLTWVFKMNAGAPMPDLLAVFNGLVAPPPGFDPIAIGFEGHARGPLHAVAGLGPEGTPGRVIVAQTGHVFSRGFPHGANADGFPAEIVELRAIGR